MIITLTGADFSKNNIGNLKPLDLFSVIPTVTRTSKSTYGVTFTWNGDICSVSGTASSAAFTNMLVMEPLEAPVVPGATYRLEFNRTADNINMTVFQRPAGGASAAVYYTEDCTFTVGDNVDRIVIRIEVPAGKTVNGTISPKMYLA